MTAITGSALPARRHKTVRPRQSWAEFYDPDGVQYGIPTFPYRSAPAGLATRRQLRAQGLRPGGQQVQAQILWRHRRARRVAYLYDVTQAKPKRDATPAQQQAIAEALSARRTCPTCGQDQGFCIPRSLGECWQCADTARRPERQPSGYEAEPC